MRTSKANRPATPIAGHLIEANAPIANDVIDHWIALRTERAHSPIGYTPAVNLYGDFSQWHEATFPDAELPSDSAFATALAAAPRVRVEMLPVTRFGAGDRMATCANLTLRRPLRSVA